MKHAIKSMGTGHHHSSARVVDGKLILSFPNAMTPVVWQMDLTDAKSSALEVHEVKGSFVLMLKNMKGEKTEVAPFEKRQDAVDALMAVSKALENAQGQIRAGSSEGAAPIHYMPAPRARGSWLGVVLGIFLLLVLLMTWSAITPRPPRAGDGSAPVAASSTDPNSTPDADGIGKPVDADSELMKNK